MNSLLILSTLMAVQSAEVPDSVADMYGELDELVIVDDFATEDLIAHYARKKAVGA